MTAQAWYERQVSQPLGLANDAVIKSMFEAQSAAGAQIWQQDASEYPAPEHATATVPASMPAGGGAVTEERAITDATNGVIPNGTACG